MTRKIGEEFEVKLRVIVVESVRPCVECIFLSYCSCEELNGLGNCDADEITDGKNIHFEIASSY